MRASNIEFLRIFAIIGVFFLHFYNPIIGGDCLKTITAKMSPNISYC